MNDLLHDLSWVLPLRTPLLTVFFKTVTLLGYAPFFLIFLPFGYWFWDKKLFTRLAVLIIISSVLNLFLKHYFEDPRPPLEFALDGRVKESFGFPSGHAQVTIATWFWFSYELKRRWLWVVSIFLVIAICFSRLYLGVHDLEDILGGAFIGIITLLIFRWAVSDTFNLWHNAHPLIQLTTLIAILPSVWIFWPAGQSPYEAFSLLGFLFGWWSGVVFKRKYPQGEVKQYWVAAIFGLAAAGLLVYSYELIEKLFLMILLPRMLASWIQGALIGLYVTVAVPALFKRLRITNLSDDPNKL